MPKIVPALGAAQVARINRPGLHAVGNPPGLHVQVSPTGARSWVLRVLIGSKRRDIGLGGLVEVTLAEAREQARKFRAMIREGIDPLAERRKARAELIAEQAKAITFKDAAERAHRAKAAGFRNVKHRADWISSLERYAFPIIGNMPVSSIEVAHVQQVLEPIWHDRTETASRLRQRIESVLAWAAVSGFRSGDNPARWDGNLKALMAAPDKIRKHVNYKALPWKDVPAFIAELRKRDGVSVKALEFAVVTGSRSGEVRGMTWGEISLETGLWTIPAERMKAGRKHEVPLSGAALAILQDVPRMEGCPYVFPAPRGGMLSDMALNAICRRMEVPAVPHGFRSSFKDWARNNARDAEGHLFPDEVSELALAHVNSDATRAAYARDGLLPMRRAMLDQWARFCTPTAANVTPIRKGAKA